MLSKDKTVKNIVLTFSPPCNIFINFLFTTGLLLLSIIFLILFLQILCEAITLADEFPGCDLLFYVLGAILLLLLFIMNFLLSIYYIKRDRMLHIHAISFDGHIITICESKTKNKIIIDMNKHYVRRGENCFLLFDSNRNINYIFMDDFISRLEITPDFFYNQSKSKCGL